MVVVFLFIIRAPFNSGAVYAAPKNDQGSMHTETAYRYPAAFSRVFTDSLFRAKKAGYVKNLRPLHSGLPAVSEKLVYSMGWGPISAGYVYLNQYPDTIAGITILSIKAATNDFFSAFFKVRDYFATSIDSSGLYPFFFEHHINEGNYHAQRWELYDQQRNIVYSSRKKPDFISVQPFTQNPLSCIYYLRTFDLTPGSSVNINCFIGSKCVTVVMQCLKRIKIVVPAGKFTCLLIKPSLMENGHVIPRKEEVSLWVTDDVYKMPVLIETKITWGTVLSRLIRYERKE